ncbi:hypothetical protein FRB99_002914 [Tulasnella sp. 403]|nr:hypothetical protein FRB99_002914 [Tulasnella sp. 403]
MPASPLYVLSLLHAGHRATANRRQDKKAVDAKKAQIKHQLATQGMIRGQAKNPALQTTHQPQPQSDIPSYLTVPGKLSGSPSQPSSQQSSLTRTRHERAAKTQANASLHLSATPSSRGSPTSEDDGSGSDDDEYSGSPHHHDSEMSPLPPEEGLELPRLFGPGAATSSSATPSFPNSPLHTAGGFGEPESAFSTTFTIPGLTDTASAIDGMIDNSLLGNPLSDIPSAPVLDDPYGHIDLQLGMNYDIYAATLPGAFVPPSSKPYPHAPHPTMSLSLPMKPATSELVSATSEGTSPLLSASSANAPLSSTSTSTMLSTSTSPMQTTTRQPSPSVAIGMTVTSPTGVTMPAFGPAYTGIMSEGYFPAQPLSTSPPPVMATSSASSNAVVPARSRQNTNTSRGYLPQPPPVFTPFVPTTGQQNPAFGTITIAYKPQIRTPLADPSRSLSNFQETLVFYYFNRGVRRMQYLLADDSTTGVTDVMYDLVIRDPLGPVTNAICALASLHDTRLRIAHGLLHPEDPHAHDNAQKLYSDTVIQLSKKAGQFTPVEAIASLHLLSFWLFCGGGGDWASALGMAGDWLMRSEVMNDALDPVEVLERWPAAQRFAAQGTLWFDILGSCSMRQTPRFIQLYRRMRERNKRVGASGGTTQQILFGSQQKKVTGQASELMNQVMGCDDDIMLALAEIADLAAWKEKQMELRTLSVRELVERGRLIEEGLNNTKVISTSAKSRSPASGASPTQQSTFTKAPPVWDPYNVNALSSAVPSQSANDMDATWTMDGHRRSQSVNSPPPGVVRTSPPSASSSSVTGTPGPLSIITTSEPVTLRQLSSNVFREAAFLYLHSTVNGPEPAVREIRESVAALMTSILAIPSKDLDRSLAFPITLGGCLADTVEQREFFAERLAAQGSAVGNGSQAKLLMETVWKKRDAGQQGVCWRDTMKELGFDLLLV